MSASPVLTTVAFSLAFIYVVLSLLKTSLRSFSRVAIRRIAEDCGPRRRRLLESFLDEPAEFILHLQTVIQLSLVSIAVIITDVLVVGTPPVSFVWPLLSILTFTLVFEHIFPRFVMSIDRERLLIGLLPAYSILEPFVRMLASPISWLFRSLLREREVNNGEVSDEELKAFIDVGEEAGILEADEAEMLESLVDFGDTVVREVMTPRVDIKGIEVGCTVAEARDAIIETKHSRLPVYRDRVDNIEGTVDIRDLLRAWTENVEDSPLTGWMKPTVFVPDTKKVSDLLKDFQRSQSTFAIVVDEYGGTSGLVTIEDLVEEIVGEITEEHEQAPPSLVPEADGSYLFSAKTALEDLEDIFDLQLGDEGYDTLGGLVFATLGRVPTVGEEFTYSTLRLKVLEADKRRVTKVQVWAAAKETADEAASKATEE